MTREREIAKAHELRAEGLSDVAIAKRFGVTPSTVWKWRHPERAKELARRSNAKRNREKQEWEHTQRHPCAGGCGTDVGYRSTLCLSCIRAKWEADRVDRWLRLRDLWDDPTLSAEEIARDLGFKNANSMSVFINRMKLRGYELSPRRPGWKGHARRTGRDPISGPLTPERARARYADAVLRGALKRPDACERCGDTGNIEGHHHDLTGAPLEVEWLCRVCHMAEHARTAVAA